MKKLSFVFCVLISVSAALYAAPVELVKDGKAVSEIVTAPDANQSVKLAAKDLQDVIRRMSGAELKIVNAPTPDIKNQVYVGTSQFTDKIGFKPAKFTNSGFEIVAKNNYVILSGYDRLSKTSPFDNKENLKKWQDFCGEKFNYSGNGAGVFNAPLNIHINDDTGTWYAASELLEQLGVRFYAPYENGTVIPERKDISIAEQNLKSEAVFGKREWCYYNAMRSDKDGVEWLKRLRAGTYAPIIFAHTTYNVYSSKEQHELHPEYLACDKDGMPYSGYPAGAGMPRFGNAEFRKASVLLMNKLFEAHPELSGICMGQPDGGIKIDARDINLYGKEGDSSEQRIANCFWEYNVALAKELKKSHPDKSLIYFAYGSGVNLLPTNMKSDDPDNIIIAFVDSSSGRVLKTLDNSMLDVRRNFVSAVKQKSKSPEWDYYLYYRSSSNPRFPVFFTESLQKQMKEMQPYVDGKFMELQPEWLSKGKNPQPSTLIIGESSITHLMIYWQNKLLWNPDIDRKAMLEEYYKLFFGPAATEMKEFHEFAEEVWCRQDSRSVTQTTGFLKEADVNKYFEILAKAREKAGKDSVYDKRIAAMETAYQPLKKLFANLQRQGPDLRSYSVPNDTKLDGDVSREKYKNGWITLRDKTTGETPNLNRTDVNVSISEDKQNLYVAAVCYDNKMDKIKAETKLNDTASIFNDDVIEVYINSPEKSYFKIVVNANGAIWDESTDVSIIERDTLQILWNPGIKAVVKKYADRWTVELMIPTKDFGKLGPTKQYPWGIQIGRTRFAEGTEIWALGTGPGPYSTLTQWGNLWVR